jgi:hypothetical protein
MPGIIFTRRIRWIQQIFERSHLRCANYKIQIFGNLLVFSWDPPMTCS